MSTQPIPPIQQFFNYLVRSKRASTVLMVLAGLAILGVSSWAWWTKVYTNPHRVFWDAIDQNLTVPGYTKSVKTDNESQKFNQTVQVQFAESLRSKTTTDITQPSSSVISETLGTNSGGYARYVKIDAKPKEGGKKTDFSSIEGVWSKLDADANRSPTSMLDEAVFGPVMLGNLDYTQRHEIIKNLRSKRAYEIDYGKVKKSTQNGRKVYTYPVSVRPKSYIDSVSKYYGYIGLDGDQFKGGQYSDDNKVTIEFTVDVLSHRMVTLAYTDGSNRKEFYEPASAVSKIEIPTKTITTSELQQRLQKIQE